MNDKLKVLALAPYPEEAASTRFRIAQFIPLLAEQGIRCELKPFISAKLFKGLYRKERLARKAIGFGWSALARLRDLVSAGSWDVVFVQREAALVGPPLVERALANIFRKPLVLDMDDPLWINYTSPVYGRLTAPIRCLGKTDELIRRADTVICGNAFIAEHVNHTGSRAIVLPTIVDTNTFSPRREKRTAGPAVIGWVGTHTTLPYLEAIAPVLEQLASRHSFKLKVVGGGRALKLRGVEVEDLPWLLDREVEDFRSLDIGLYPLADDDWARGKSGFKAIQYLSCGVPFIASPVGVARDIVETSGGGLLAGSQAEWLDGLDRLLTDTALCHAMGETGRAYALSHYRILDQAKQMGEILRAAALKARAAQAVAAHS